MILVIISSVFVIIYSLRKWFQYKRFRWSQTHQDCLSVAFFHPYCNAGGGGERVLWTAIRALQEKYPELHCVVYTGDITATKEDILEKISSCFNIILSSEQIHFIFLKRRKFVEAKMYPYFTLFFQSCGAIILGLEALFKFVPNIYIDSMGYAFTLPLFRILGGCHVGCYVHYPTISTDMLDAVSSQREAANNRRFISRSKYLSSLKLIYYRFFALLYGFVGKASHVVMVNSTWTRNHIVALWRNTSKIYLVYPPCDVTEFEKLDVPDPTKNRRILSIAQFRPEKDHSLQIKAFHKYYEKAKEMQNSTDIKLILAGSCRSEEDRERVNNLKKLAESLGIIDNIEFKVNISFKELLNEMGNAGIALHTMWNEHFGIGIVESMSAGQIVIAHNSGGPKLDIVVSYYGNITGYLADDVDSYAKALELISTMPKDKQMQIRESARKSAKRFSVSEFEESFLNAFQLLLK